MPTPRETILAALLARLASLPATVLRGEVLPERVPAEGLLILRDGEPGEPEVSLSPLAYRSCAQITVRCGTWGKGSVQPRARNWGRQWVANGAGWQIR